MAEIAVSAAQASQIKAIYNGLDQYDKRAVEVHLKLQPQLRGWFCSQKRTGHTSREQVNLIYLVYSYIFACIFVIGVFFLGLLYHLAQPEIGLLRPSASSRARSTRKHKQLLALVKSHTVGYYF